MHHRQPDQSISAVTTRLVALKSQLTRANPERGIPLSWDYDAARLQEMLIDLKRHTRQAQAVLFDGNPSELQPVSDQIRASPSYFTFTPDACMLSS